MRKHWELQRWYDVWTIEKAFVNGFAPLVTRLLYDERGVQKKGHEMCNESGCSVSLYDEYLVRAYE